MSPRLESSSVPAVVLALFALFLVVSSTALADSSVCTIQAPSSFTGNQQFGSCNGLLLLSRALCMHLHASRSRTKPTETNQKKNPPTNPTIPNSRRQQR